MFFLNHWRKPTVSQGKSPDRNLACRGTKDAGPTKRLLSATAAREEGSAGRAARGQEPQGGRTQRGSSLRCAGRRNSHCSQRAPGRKVSAVSDRSKLEGWSNFFPTLQTKRSASTDSTMGPLKPESDNGRGGGTIQLKTKADSSQNSLPEALQSEGKNKRVKIDSTLIHSNCTTGIIGISEVEIIKWLSFKS